MSYAFTGYIYGSSKVFIAEASNEHCSTFKKVQLNYSEVKNVVYSSDQFCLGDTISINKHDFYSVANGNYQLEWIDSVFVTSMNDSVINYFSDSIEQFKGYAFVTNGDGCQEIQTTDYYNATPDKPSAWTYTDQNDELIIKTNYDYWDYVDIQWLDCSNGMTVIEGETSQYFGDPEIGSEYAVTVTNNSGCADTSDCIEYGEVGIEDIIRNSSLLQLFPNPARNNVFLKLNTSTSNEYQIIVVNAIGQDILSFTRTIRQGAAIKIDLEGIQPGIYFIKLVDKGIAYTKSFVVK